MIVYFAGSPYEGVAGTDHHIAGRIGAVTPVLYVDPPRRTAGHPGPHQVRPGLWRLSPWVPPGAYRPGVHFLTTLLVRRAARQAVATLGLPVTAVIVATCDDLLDALPKARSLFYATDDLVSGAELIGLPRRRLRAGQARLLARADVVAAVSPVLAERLGCEPAGRHRRAPVTVVPNGCDCDAYRAVDLAPWPHDVPCHLAAPGHKPVAGFVGHINARIDIGLLEAIAARGTPLLLVGPRHPAYQPDRFPALVARPNVYWVGPKPFSELRCYLRVIDVGLTPYAMTEFNRASFPLKTLEYLAAGRGVVSTDLPATTWLRGDPDGAAVIDVARTPAEFAGAIDAAAARPPSLARRRRDFAHRHDWSQRARMIIELLASNVAEARA